MANISCVPFHFETRFTDSGIYIGIRKYRDEENKKVMDNIEKTVVRYFQVAFLFVIIGISILVIGFCINIVNR